MYVDVKVTVWQRIKLNEDEDVSAEDVIEMLKLHEPYMDFLWDEKKFSIDWDTITDTEEYLPAEENGGQSTVELYDNDGKLLWNNQTIQ